MSAILIRIFCVCGHLFRWHGFDGNCCAAPVGDKGCDCRCFRTPYGRNASQKHYNHESSNYKAIDKL